MKGWVARGIRTVDRPQRPPIAVPLFWQALSQYFGLDADQQARVWGAISQARWSITSCRVIQ
jgi:hypothetical protein